MEYEIGAALRFDTLTGRRADGEMGRWADALSGSQLGTLRAERVKEREGDRETSSTLSIRHISLEG